MYQEKTEGGYPPIMGGTPFRRVGYYSRLYDVPGERYFAHRGQTEGAAPSSELDTIRGKAMFREKVFRVPGKMYSPDGGYARYNLLWWILLGG